MMLQDFLVATTVFAATLWLLRWAWQHIKNIRRDE